MTQPSLAIPFWSPAEIEASLAGTIAHLQDGRLEVTVDNVDADVD